MFLYILLLASSLASHTALKFIDDTKDSPNDSPKAIRERPLSHIFSQNNAPNYYIYDESPPYASLDTYNPNPIEYLKFPSFATFGNLNVNKRDITIFTQLSMNRIDLISDIAASWSGSVSVALYVESYADIDKLDSALYYLKIRMQEAPYNKCMMIVSLLFGVEFIASPKALKGFHPYDLLYPINALRNLALLQAPGDLVFSLDADFVPSANSFEFLTRPSFYDQIVKQSTSKTVFVIAAFELLVTSGFSLPITRSELDRLCQAAKIIPFHSKITINVNDLDSEKMNQWCRGEILNYHTKITAIQVFEDRLMPSFSQTLLVGSLLLKCTQ
jgi:hypothetical protein